MGPVYLPRRPGAPPAPLQRRQRRREDQIPIIRNQPIALTIPRDAPANAYLAVPIFYVDTRLVLTPFTGLPIPTSDESLSIRTYRARLTLCLMYFYKIFLWCRIYYDMNGLPRQYGKEWSLRPSRRLMIRPLHVMSGLLTIYHLVNSNTTPIAPNTRYVQDGNGLDITDAMGNKTIQPDDNSVEALCQYVMKMTFFDPQRNHACLGGITSVQMAGLIRQLVAIDRQSGKNEEEDLLRTKQILEATLKNVMATLRAGNNRDHLIAIFERRPVAINTDRFLQGYYSEPSFPLRMIIREFTISWNIGTRYQSAHPDIKKFLMGRSNYSDAVAGDLAIRALRDPQYKIGVPGDDAILQKSIVQGKDMNPPIEGDDILEIDQPRTDDENTPEFHEKLTDIIMNLFQLYGQYCFVNARKRIDINTLQFTNRERTPHEFYESELTEKIRQALLDYMPRLDLLRPNDVVDRDARRIQATDIRNHNAGIMAGIGELFGALPVPDTFQYLTHAAANPAPLRMARYDMNDSQDFYCFLCEIIIPFLYIKIWEIMRQMLVAMNAQDNRAYRDGKRRESQSLEREYDRARRVIARGQVEMRNEWQDAYLIARLQLNDERQPLPNRVRRLKQMAQTWYYLLGQFQSEYLNTIHTSAPYSTDPGFYRHGIVMTNVLFMPCSADNILRMLLLPERQVIQDDPISLNLITQNSQFFQQKQKAVYHAFIYLKKPSGLPPSRPQLVRDMDQPQYIRELVEYMKQRARHLSPKNQRFMLKYCCQYDSQCLNQLLPRNLDDLNYLNTTFYDSRFETDNGSQNYIKAIMGDNGFFQYMNYLRSFWYHYRNR